MHYVIMGCGRVGSSLSRSLEKFGHTVSVIDSDTDAFRRLGPSFRGSTVTGIGFDREVLMTAGIERAAGFAAVTNGDNSNILGARVARESFGVETVVARIYDPARAEVYERLGIPTVATVRWATEQVLGKLIDLGAQSLWRDPSGSIRLTSVAFHPAWIGRPIREIEKILHTPVPSLGRFGAGIVTTDSTVLQEHDVLYVIVETSRTAAVHELLANPPERN